MWDTMLLGATMAHHHRESPAALYFTVTSCVVH